MARFDPKSYSGLDRLGRIALSESFHLREFLYSIDAAFVRNISQLVLNSDLTV